MARRLAGRYGYPEAPNHFDVTLHPDRLEQPLRWKKPRTVFVCSMSDLFHEDVPDDFIEALWVIMTHASQHTFQILTKRPERMALLSDQFTWRWSVSEGRRNQVPENIWLGVSVESPDYLWRIDELMKCPAAVRFVSLEPLLAATDLAPYLTSSCLLTTVKHLQWVICGGESGPGARPMHPDWVRDIRDQCQAAGVPLFFKQWGRWKPYDASSDDDDFIADLTEHDRLRKVKFLHISGYDGPTWKETVTMLAVGEKRASRLFDGRTWDGMPSRKLIE